MPELDPDHPLRTIKPLTLLLFTEEELACIRSIKSEPSWLPASMRPGYSGGRRRRRRKKEDPQ